MINIWNFRESSIVSFNQQPNPIPNSSYKIEVKSILRTVALSFYILENNNLSSKLYEWNDLRWWYIKTTSYSYILTAKSGDVVRNMFIHVLLHSTHVKYTLIDAVSFQYS